MSSLSACARVATAIDRTRGASKLGAYPLDGRRERRVRAVKRTAGAALHQIHRKANILTAIALKPRTTLQAAKEPTHRRRWSGGAPAYFFIFEFGLGLVESLGLSTRSSGSHAALFFAVAPVLSSARSAEAVPGPRFWRWRPIYPLPRRRVRWWRRQACEIANSSRHIGLLAVAVSMAASMKADNGHCRGPVSL